MHRQIIAAAAFVLLSCTLTGCADEPQDDARSADETKAIKSLTTMFSSGENANSVTLFGPDFPGCFAETIVDEAGVKLLTEDKVLTEENEASKAFEKAGKVSDKSAGAFAEAEYDCIDWDQVSKYLKENNDAKVDEVQLDDYVTCMREIAEADWKAASKDRALGKRESDAITSFDTAASGCQPKIPE